MLARISAHVAMPICGLIADLHVPSLPDLPTASHLARPSDLVQMQAASIVTRRCRLPRKPTLETPRVAAINLRHGMHAGEQRKPTERQ